jgi:hypothetical protein
MVNDFLCRDVLVMAAHNETQRLNVANIATEAKAGLCTQGQQTSSRDTHGDLDILYVGSEGYGKGGGNYDQSQIDDLKQSACSHNGNSLDSHSLDVLLQNVVNNDAVAAWRECMSNGGQGLRSLIQRNGDELILQLWWQDRGVGVPTVTVTDASISGLIGSCVDAPWPPRGMTIGSAVRQHVCTRKGDERVTLSVETDHGSTLFAIPAKITIPQPQPQPVIAGPLSEITGVWCGKYQGSQDRKMKFDAVDDHHVKFTLISPSEPSSSEFMVEAATMGGYYTLRAVDSSHRLISNAPYYITWKSDKNGGMIADTYQVGQYDWPENRVFPSSTYHRCN